MIKKYFILVFINLVLLTFFFLYYNHQRQIIDVLTVNNVDLIKRLKTQIVVKNNITAYNQLRTLYIYKPNEGEYLFYSLIIANQCHYPQAYFDVYHELMFIENIKLNKVDNKDSRRLMISYLIKGAELDHQQSKNELGKIYMQGKYLPKDTILGKKLVK